MQEHLMQYTTKYHVVMMLRQVWRWVVTAVLQLVVKDMMERTDQVTYTTGIHHLT